MIQVEALAKHFGSVTAVDQVSFQVKRGEILGLLGPNGAGKTTTLRLIAGYLRPDAGKITVGGLDGLDERQPVRNLIGYLPEYNPLYEDMLVYDYLHFVAAMRELPADQREARVNDMISVCGLEGVVHKKISEVSKGNRQRVGLAQAMIHDPEYLILDEPTAGLDPNQISDIRDLIKRLGREKTVILSSHILSEVEATCDRVVIIHQGKVVADSNPRDLQRQSVDESRLHLRIGGGESRAILEQLKKMSAVLAVERTEDENGEIHGFLVRYQPETDLRPEVFRLAGREGWTLYEMHREVVSLEDVFRRLTAN